MSDDIRDYLKTNASVWEQQQETVREIVGKTNGELWAAQFPELAKVQGASRAKNLAQPTPRKQPRSIEVPMLRRPERAGDVIVLPMPLPHRDLQPNRKLKVNEYKLTRLTKATRGAAEFIAGLVRPPEPWQRVRIDVKLWGAGRLDRVSVLEYLKATIDGVADGIGTNDRHFEPGDIVHCKERGRREVEIQLTKLS